MTTNELEQTVAIRKLLFRYVQKCSPSYSGEDNPSDEIIAYLNKAISQAKEKEARRVINAIADKEGWEESRDYYMKALAKPKE